MDSPAIPVEAVEPKHVAPETAALGALARAVQEVAWAEAAAEGARPAAGAAAGAREARAEAAEALASAG